MNLSDQAYTTLTQVQEAGVATFNYGAFINTVVDFLIVAFAIFIVVGQMNRFKKKEAPAVPTTKDCRFCLSFVPLKASRCPSCTSKLQHA